MLTKPSAAILGSSTFSASSKPLFEHPCAHLQIETFGRDLVVGFVAVLFFAALLRDSVASHAAERSSTKDHLVPHLEVEGLRIIAVLKDTNPRKVFRGSGAWLLTGDTRELLRGR